MVIRRTSRSSRARLNNNSQRRLSLLLEQLEDRRNMAVAVALSGSSLLSFDTASPAITQTTPVTGVNAGETLVGIDFRPQNGNLYALGVATAGAGTLYNISSRTGVATVIGTAGSVTPVAPMPDPTLATSGFAFDFNPLVDRIRVLTSAGQSFALDPNSGLVVANAPNINGGTTTADGTGYTNNQPNTTATTLYTIDSVTDTLYLQNAATSLTTPIGGLGFDFTRVNGFDIPAGVSVPTSGTPVTTGSGFAILNVGGTTGLYSVNLVNGASTLVGNVGNGTTAVSGLAIQNDLGGIPAIALDASGPNLVRFNTSTPGTTTTVAITGITSGETLVGIDYRPATGQVYGLGINAGADTGTLYRIDPQTGSATISVTGTGGAITFAGEDFPDPATAGYGFDFNPDVDRVRITTSTGLSFRINPITGLPAAATTDTDINGSGVTGISAAAYTNSNGNDVAVLATTLYTLDAATDTLYIQNPPNNGTQTTPHPITLGVNPLNFTDVSGFDIPGGVVVSTANAAVTSGFAYATLTVGGLSGLYRIDLTSGAATSVGTIGAGLTPFAGLTLADAPAGTVSFTATTSTVGEGDGNATINLTRTGSSNGELTVTVNVTGGTATAGSDVTAGPYTATFADGATTASITIPITDDVNVIEGDETLIVTIAAANNGAVIGAQNTHTLTITNNDTNFDNESIIAMDPVSGRWFGSNLTTGNSQTIAQWAPNVGWQDGKVADFNGDGVSDISARTGTGRIWVALATPSSSTPFAAGTLWAGTPSAVDTYQVGDFNDDGKADIAAFIQPASGVRWLVLTTNASATAFDSSFMRLNSSVDWTGFVVADFTGDGRSDLAARVDTSGNEGSAYWVAEADATGSFSTSSRWSRTSPAFSADTLGADYNGDGKADIVARNPNTGKWQLLQSNGSAFTPRVLNGTWATDAVGGWQNVQIADLDGDGKDDIIGRRSNGNWSWIHRNGTSDVFSANIGNWPPSDDFKSIFVGDLDRDGDDQIFGRRGTDGIWRIDELSSGLLQTLTDPNLQPDWDETIDWMFAALGQDDGDLY